MPPAASLLGSFVVGIVLGLLAIAVDEEAVPGGRILVVLLSSGLSWGAAAVLMGALARARSTAAAAGCLALLAAVGTYYGVNEFADLRPGGSLLQRAALLWGLVAVVGGPPAGIAGWYARRGTARARGIAWGVLAGLLAGQGVYWATRYGLLLDPVLLLALVVPLVVLAWGIARRGVLASTAMPALLVATALSAIAWSFTTRIP